ncbi:MAG TPA: methyltransferase domain-containing protein [Deltaproteobacteria bacterium]|nr:methyltransferase domain-containing protein [Deltaproteobacteria bacterium]
MTRPSPSIRITRAIRPLFLSGALMALLWALACTPELKARAYAGAERDEWQQADRVVASLGLRPGDVVADLGAGGGYFTFLLAEAVGPSGTVYAIDVDEPMNERLARLAKERGMTNVETILATPGDPRIPEGGVDLVFTSNTYHHLENRPDYFRRLATHLRPGGRLAVLDYKKHGLVPGLLGHSTEASIIQRELESAGYRLVRRYDFIEKQHFLIFAPNES